MRTCPQIGTDVCQLTMRSAILYLAVVIVCVPLPAAALTPPWCNAEGLNASERMICADDILSRLDLELNEAYEEAKRAEADLGQASWLSERNACGISVSCLETAYRTRIAELHGIAEREIRHGELGVPNWNQPEEAIGSRSPHSEQMSELDALPLLADMVPRPWCNAPRLNATERTICVDLDLSRLDALLELAYGRVTARNEDTAQVEWLRSKRDICGTDRVCIATAYAERIEALSEPFAQAAEQRYDTEIPPGHYPPPGSCRLWYPDRPPGHQPPPTSCNVWVPPGAILIEG